MNPLVTVVIITYNSSKFIVETLESVKSQTYNNIELIITDDCSTDNTVESCNNWLKQNKSIFFDASIITSKRNTGIASNANRGWYKAKGKWIKALGGDDLLKITCIEEFIKESQKEECDFYMCGYQFNYENGNIKLMMPDSKMFKGNSQKQLKNLIVKGTTIAGITFFIKKEVFIILGGFSEKYQFCEDTPFVVKYLKSGRKIKLLNKVLVEYRKHSLGVSSSGNKLFLDAFNSHFEDEVLPIMKDKRMFLYLWHYKVTSFLKNHKAQSSFKLLNYSVKLLDPITIIRRLKKWVGYSHPFEDKNIT